jgi:uncharacterized protein (DUF1501 family)
MPTNPDPTRVVDLGNSFAGVHPAMRDIAPIFNAGQMAVVHRVAYSDQSRSHFDSQKYWENGVPRGDSVYEGVLYRALTKTGLHVGREFPAVSVQSSTPLMLRGKIAMPNLSDPARYDFLGVANGGNDRDKLMRALTAAHNIPHPTKDNREMLFSTGASLEASIDGLKSLGLDSNEFFDTDGTTHLFPIDSASNQKGFSSGSYGFFDDLKVAAQVLAGTDAVITGTRLDGFDTHNDQGALTGGHPRLLSWLGWGLYALRKFMMDRSPALWNDTVVITLSEFGRTSEENGSQGTDHAEANVMFIMGGSVKGGVYQCSNSTWPTGLTGAMFQVNDRYLQRTVDYRSILGEIIRKHLGATQTELNSIIPGYADPNERLLSGGVSSDDTPIVGEVGLL